MNNRNIEISLLKDNEINDLLHFYNDLYKTNRTVEMFLWEFYNAPAGKAIYVIAKDSANNKIVGSQCAIPFELITNDGTVILSGKSEDTLVHPDYRGLSIFENMYQLLFEECQKNGIKYLWGFTTAKKPFIKLGFEIPYNHSQSLFVKNIFTAYNYISKLNAKNNSVSLAKIFALCSFSRFSSFKKSLVSQNWVKTLDVVDKIEFVDNSKLISKSKYKGFAIRQDLNFLNWRIKENPYFSKIYTIYFSSKTQLLANIIFNHHKNGVWYLNSDTYSDSLTESQKTEIIASAIHYLSKNEKGNVKLIRTWDFTHNEYGNAELKIRKSIGFVHLERGISFVWKNLDENNLLSVYDFNLSRLGSQGIS